MENHHVADKNFNFNNFVNQNRPRPSRPSGNNLRFISNENKNIKKKSFDKKNNFINQDIPLPRNDDNQNQFFNHIQQNYPLPINNNNNQINNLNRNINNQMNNLNRNNTQINFPVLNNYTKNK